MVGIRAVIDAMGYSRSNSLLYRENADTVKNRHIQKLFRELNPDAIYTADDKPFVIFYESAEKCIPDLLVKRVWNAQIPLMIISFDNRIEVYNGCSIDDGMLILLEEIDVSQVTLDSPFSFWNIANSDFWKNYDQKMSAPKLDSVMLSNIREAAVQLRDKPCAPFAVKLILRLIFIRYLIDRGVDIAYKKLTGNISQSQSHFLEILHDKKELYTFFAYLKKRFNGNLFELYETCDCTEYDLLEQSALDILHDLVAGNLVMLSGQTSLFPFYDFNIIPVELISSIYERFLGAEQKKSDKAFYTPPFLADYVLKQTVAPFLEKNSNCKVLDPACGSGIFLVETARMLIERCIELNPDTFDDEMLITTITENIWGIDKNPDAVAVAVFSLYLTILDYKDPKTLRNFLLPPLENKNLFICDFFSSDAETFLDDIGFDFIIGNPPWGSVAGQHEVYCRDNNLPICRKEISRSFVLRVKDFSAANTCCCLIVTSKLFYNKLSPAVDFRKWLLMKTKISKYIETAPVRELLFSSAVGPAGIIVCQFNESVEENIKNEICHITLMPNVYFKLFRIIATEKNNYKYVPQALLFENDWAWKTLVFGYSQDFRTIKSLMNRFTTVKQVIKATGLKYGTGIHTADGAMQETHHLRGRWLIDAKNGIKPFQVNIESGSTFNKMYIDRAKKDKQFLFRSPYTLMKKGFNINDFRFRAAYSEDDFLYTDAITGICGSQNQNALLLSLAGVLNSSFYSYLNLMLGSSSGIEREQAFPTEVFEYPTVEDSEKVNRVALHTKEVMQSIEKDKKFFNSGNKSQELIRDLDATVLEVFGVQNNLFIDYAIKVQIPLVAGNKTYWEKVDSTQLREYANVFIKHFSSVLSHGEKFISASIYKDIAGLYCAVEFVFQNKKPEVSIAEHDCAKDRKMMMESKFLVNRVNDIFYQIKDVIDFSEESFYIMKTNEQKNWHPAMAKLDLSDVCDSIMFNDEAHGL